MSYNSPPLLHACLCLPFCLKLQMRMHHQVLRCSEQTTPANAPVNEAHMMLEIRHPNMRQQHSHCRKLWHNRSKSCPLFLFVASRRPRKRGIPAGTLLPSKHASEEAGFVAFVNKRRSRAVRLGSADLRTDREICHPSWAAPVSRGRTC